MFCLYIYIYIYIYISPRASDKHHITFEALLHKSNEFELEMLLNEFIIYLTKCKTLVAHNVKSDLRTLKNELLRCDMISNIDINICCTMAQTNTYCNCKDVLNRLKQPRLDELYHKLFDEQVDNTLTHNSCYDVEVCAKCYVGYINMSYVKQIDLSKLFNNIHMKLKHYVYMSLL